MDPGSILALIELSCVSGKKLYSALTQIRDVDDQTDLLRTELRAMSDALDQLDHAVRSDPGGTRGTCSGFWTSIRPVLTDCERQLRRLELSITSVEGASRGASAPPKQSALTQPWRALKLNLHRDEIAQARTFIRSYTLSISLSLNVLASYVNHS